MIDPYRTSESNGDRIRRPPVMVTGEICAWGSLSGGDRDKRSPVHFLRGYTNVGVKIDGDMWRTNNGLVWYRAEYWEDFDHFDDRNRRTTMGRSRHLWRRFLRWSATVHKRLGFVEFDQRGNAKKDTDVPPT